jgi:hypothetical protein
MLLANQYVGMFGIEQKKENESVAAFQSRVSGVLRDNNMLIEAHEVYHNKRYENDEDVMTGIIGAVAQTFQNNNYRSRGSRQVGHDIAAGLVTKNPEPQMSTEAALLLLELLGKRK